MIMLGVEKPALPSSSSSSILSSIQKCKEGTFITKIDEWGFKNYELGLIAGSRKAYIGAEVHFDSLDRGSDLSTDYQQKPRCDSNPVRDHPMQFICAKLGGGTDSSNIFSINERIDTSEWKFAQQEVYDFVKKGKGKSYARLMFGNKIQEKSIRPRRPQTIYYHFELFENGTKVDQAIEGTLENLRPGMTLTTEDIHKIQMANKDSFEDWFTEEEKMILENQK